MRCEDTWCQVVNMELKRIGMVFKGNDSTENQYLIKKKKSEQRMLADFLTKNNIRVEDFALVINIAVHS